MTAFSAADGMTDTPENRALCLAIMRREIKALGYDGLGYAISFHIDARAARSTSTLPLAGLRAPRTARVLCH